MSNSALICLCSIGLFGITRGALTTSKTLPSILLSRHDLAMRAAIAMAVLNPVYSLGAVITNPSNGAALQLPSQ